MIKALFFLLISFPLVLNAQVKGECKKANSFLRVQIYDGIIATLERGEGYKLCPGTDTDLDDLQISINDSVLRIRKIPGKNYEIQPKLRIIYHEINSIEAYAKADLDTRNLIITDSLTIVLKSGSRFYADCDVKYLKANVAEGSLLKIDGYAIKQVIVSSGKATFSGFELEGEIAEVKASTGGVIKLNVEKSILGNATTKGFITFKNTPKTDVKKNLGGKLVASD